MIAKAPSALLTLVVLGMVHGNFVENLHLLLHFVVSVRKLASAPKGLYTGADTLNCFSPHHLVFRRLMQCREIIILGIDAVDVVVHAAALKLVAVPNFYWELPPSSIPGNSFLLKLRSNQRKISKYLCGVTGKQGGATSVILDPYLPRNQNNESGETP